MHALSIQSLAKSYGPVHALRGISFDVAPGEIFGLLGPNGAGKTTAVECIIGLRRPDSGSVQIAGADALAQPARAKEIIGAQLQATALQDKITPRQALRLFGAFYAKPVEPDELLSQFDLAAKADAAFDTLSGGQRQRLAIALALVNKPQVVFLDEPTAGLDPQSRRELHAAIGQLKAAGRTILLTTHYIEEAQKLCDRIAIIDKGVLAAIGTPAELLRRSMTCPSVLVHTARLLPAEQARGLAGVTSATQQGDGWKLSTTSVTTTIQSIVHLVEAEQNDLLDLQIHHPTLEDVFLELTGTPITNHQDTNSPRT